MLLSKLLCLLFYLSGFLIPFFQNRFTGRTSDNYTVTQPSDVVVQLLDILGPRCLRDRPLGQLPRLQILPARVGGQVQNSSQRWRTGGLFVALWSPSAIMGAFASGFKADAPTPNVDGVLLCSLSATWEVVIIVLLAAYGTVIVVCSIILRRVKSHHLHDY